MRTKTFLIVEDESLIAMIAEEIVGDAGYVTVGSCPTVAAAMAWLDTNTAPDVALLDVNLGHELVWPVARRLGPLKTRMVFSTGYGRKALVAPWEDALMVQKPYTLEEFRATIALAFAEP